MHTDVDKDIQDLVIARLQTLPDGVELSIGSEGDFTKDELINHVRQGDDVGQKIIELEMSFFRSFKSGVFYGDDFTDNAA
jgi:hypothetical protein